MCTCRYPHVCRGWRPVSSVIACILSTLFLRHGLPLGPKAHQLGQRSCPKSLSLWVLSLWVLSLRLHSIWNYKNATATSSWREGTSKSSRLHTNHSLTHWTQHPLVCVSSSHPHSSLAAPAFSTNQFFRWLTLSSSLFDTYLSKNNR